MTFMQAMKKSEDTVPTFEESLATIEGGLRRRDSEITRLRASNAELLAAAKEALDNMNPDHDFHPSAREVLEQAISTAEALP